MVEFKNATIAGAAACKRIVFCSRWNSLRREQKKKKSVLLSLYRALLGYLNLTVLDFFVRQLLDGRATIDQLSSAVARRLKQA